MADILADVESLASGPIRAAGNWSPGQIVQHLAEYMIQSIDGFVLLAPERQRRIASRRLDDMLTNGFPPGIALEGEMACYLPDEVATLDAALNTLRAVVTRIATEQMTAVHPFLDALDHEQWIRFHCRHAERHLCLLHPDR